MIAKARPSAIGHRALVAAAHRFVLFLGLWLALIGFSPTDVMIGLPAAAAAVRVSFLLLPPSSGGRLSYGAIAGLFLRFQWQSLVAGIDVARRALDPRMPLRAGFVAFPARIPRGPARDAFRAVMSVQPGALPVSAGEDGDILFHCLDTDRPVAAQLAAEEARFLRIFGRERRDA